MKKKTNKKVLKVVASCGGQGCSIHEEILPKGIKVISIKGLKKAA